MYTKGEWNHTLCGRLITSPSKVIAHLEIRDMSSKEIKANARLIAQAPKMFEALKWIKVWAFQATAREQDWWDLEKAMTEIQAIYETTEKAIAPLSC